ncbi:MAG: allophanate hydrolase [Aeromicrobium sp.]|nr:allophanate hydrolase [Aeromicrobium sp.]
MTFLVEQSGLLTLLQDRGRPGLGHLGVSPSGAFDRRALHQVDALLGNPGGNAALEVLGGGLVLRAESPHTIAVTGGAGPVTIAGAPVAYGRAVPVRAGQVVRVGAATTGLRTYVGAAGGFVAPTELGSASSDTLSGIGPAPVAAGDRLAVGQALRSPEVQDVPDLTTAGDLTLDVVLGPRDDWFAPEAVRLLLDSPWQVGPASDRIGVRLAGPALVRSRHDELPSEPCVRGSIQVATDGRPIVLGPDHPVTGGYPVVAVVVDAHTDRLAQAGPGRVVRFRPVPAR